MMTWWGSFKLPISLITIVVFVFAIVALLYTERITYFSSNSIFKPSRCSKRNDVSLPSENVVEKYDSEEKIEEDNKFDFDPEECNVVNGKWVFNGSFKPLYSDRTCPYLDMQISCVKNGRPDSGYRHWEWQPEDCTLPRFDAETTLKKLRGKRLMFVGDSLQREQWQSLVCMVEWIIPQHTKSMTRGTSHSIFSAQEYNATIEFYWAPYLVESNSDINIIADQRQRILRVDSIIDHAKHWLGADILVFNTYVWWMSGFTVKSVWGSFSNGEQGYEELDVQIAYRLGLKTWANWVDSTIDPKKTRVFFTTMSPTHMRSADWNNENGIRCFNETEPAKKYFWGTGSNKEIMNIVIDVIKKMKVPVTFLNVTHISEMRIDAHASIYTENGGNLLTAQQKADPFNNADCIHWCLPGVPDTWNQIFYAHL